MSTIIILFGTLLISFVFANYANAFSYY